LQASSCDAEIARIMCLRGEANPFKENFDKLITLALVTPKRELQKQQHFQAERYLTAMKMMNVPTILITQLTTQPTNKPINQPANQLYK
jgi:hypothetical protein